MEAVSPMSTTGLDLQVENWGPAAGAPRALLLHGITSSGATWWQIAEALAERGWSVTAPDLRGHAHSPRARSYRHHELADDVLALGTGWDLVVGHSLGGVVTVLAANRDPAFADRLVLIDPALRLPGEGVDLRVSEMLELVAGADADAYQRAHPTWHRRTVEAWVESHRLVDPEAIRAILVDNQPWDVTEQAAAVRVPGHVIGADPQQGAAFTAQDGKALQELNPLWSWEIADGASHSVHRDAPQLVIDRLLA
jgi:pimeloyl-ACP methyl ester carboxylesterase